MGLISRVSSRTYRSKNCFFFVKKKKSQPCQPTKTNQPPTPTSPTTPKPPTDPNETPNSTPEPSSSKVSPGLPPKKTSKTSKSLKKFYPFELPPTMTPENPEALATWNFPMKMTPKKHLKIDLMLRWMAESCF